jgi:hypothetical protein
MWVLLMLAGFVKPIMQTVTTSGLDIAKSKKKQSLHGARTDRL